MGLLQESWRIVLQLAPWLLLGTVVAAALHMLLPAGWIRRRLRGRRGIFEAVALGVPLPLCSCGVVPTGLGLKKDGASNGAAVGFLVSTPQTGVDSILVAASFLGWPFALMKVVAALVTGVVAGLLADAVSGGSQPETLESTDEQLSPASGRGLREGVAHGVEVLRSIWVWVLVGVVASALITVAVPQGSLEQVGAWGPIVAGGIALGLSLPLYVCAMASVPIAAALVGQGLPMGAALVFLMAGPATNLGTIGAIHRQLGARIAAVYLGTIVVGSLLFAVLFDAIVPAATVVAGAHHHDHTAWWSWATAIPMLGAFAYFAVDDVRRWWGRRTAAESTGPDESIRVPVEGMTCGGCTSKLESALRRVTGVNGATVSLEPGEAVVYGDVTESTVRGIVQATGFRVPEAGRASH